MLVPLYALFRSSSYFSPAPDVFWPDRWLQLDKSTITDRAAFIPFSYSPANCAGRALALAEMRVVVALLIQRFDMSLVDGWDKREWEEHLEDFLVLCNGGLPVSLRIRV